MSAWIAFFGGIVIGNMMGVIMAGLVAAAAREDELRGIR